MAMIHCPECNKKISSEARTCPKCGFQEPFEQIRRKEREKQEEINIVACPFCKRNINRDSMVCEFCSEEIQQEVIPEQIKRDRKATLIAVGCLSVICIIVFVVLLIDKCNSSDTSPQSTRNVVENSPQDGSVWQVKEWMRENLVTPGSVDYIEWGPVVELSDGYEVRVKFRARNSFGSYSVEEKIFKLDIKGKVENLIDN